MTRMITLVLVSNVRMHAGEADDVYHEKRFPAYHTQRINPLFLYIIIYYFIFTIILISN